MRAGGRPSRLALAAGTLPFLAGVYQVAAAEVARVCAGARGPAALAAALGGPWLLLLLVSEAVSLLIWTAVLARVPLARAFPLTALSYVVVVAAGALVLHQSIGRATLLGSAFILAGTALIAVDAL